MDLISGGESCRFVDTVTVIGFELLLQKLELFNAALVNLINEIPEWKGYRTVSVGTLIGQRDDNNKKFVKKLNYIFKTFDFHIYSYSVLARVTTISGERGI